MEKLFEQYAPFPTPYWTVRQPSGDAQGGFLEHVQENLILTSALLILLGAIAARILRK